MTDWKKKTDAAFEEEEELEFVLNEAESEDGDEDRTPLAEHERPIAYIRPVSPEELRQLPPGAPEGPYYALHDGEGRPLALFTDPKLAAAAARSNQLSPVSVH